MTPYPSQSGNVLFYILLCIALFAALGYAFSRNRIGSDGISDQKAQLYASEIINYGNLIRETVVKMKLRGCNDSQFNFYNPLYTNINSNPLNAVNSTSPSDGSCDLYGANGGKITTYIIPDEALGPGDTAPGSFKPGHFAFRIGQFALVGTDGPGGTTSANDLFLSANYLSTKVCSKIALMINQNFNTGGSGTSGVYTNGSYAATLIRTTDGNGARAFCGGSANQFSLVILAR